MPVLAEVFRAALDRRRVLAASLAAERTTCWRLLHGAVEGAPGVTVDRYGDVLLVQTWRDVLEEGVPRRLADIAEDVWGVALEPVWNHRAPPVALERWWPWTPREVVGEELGIRYDVRPRHRGRDPLLFVDLRVARRRLLAASTGLSVLNLFAYTCSAGVVAARGGAREVWNVDFARSALDVGRANAERNGVAGPTHHFVVEDCLRALRAFAGLGVRRGRPPFPARTFDLVFLDPPRWSTSRQGAVDVVGDYPSLFKPAVLATAPGGTVVATNHVASVDRDAWLHTLERCAAKAGRPLAGIEVLAPEDDLPSPDGRPPLKIAWCET
jgi:23S rRNA (cytosine1962-C5)-methyltransferase